MNPGNPSAPFFRRYGAPADLRDVVECFWIVEDARTEPERKKIIPDGFPELIFHYGDPYRIDIDGEWKLQSDNLLAGQITRHFFLENTGASAMVGIKLHPTAVTRLFDVDMSAITDKVVEARDAVPTIETQLREVVRHSSTHDALVKNLTDQLLAMKAACRSAAPPTGNGVALIFRHRGMVSIAQVAEAIGVTERQAERLFKTWIGVSPKAYARIIRFNHIFELVSANKISWAELAYLTGYYDQSHFIRNFRAFTGEDPSQYYFGEENMANFFLRKGTGF